MQAETPDELDVDCPVCHNILCEPVTTPCGHAFCRPCLDDVLNSLYKRCPTCRGPLDSSLGVPAVSVLLASLVQRASPEAYASRQRELAAEAEQRRAAAAHGALPVRAAHVHRIPVPCPCPGQQALVTWSRTEDLRFLNALYSFLPAQQRCFVQPCNAPGFAGVLVRVLACAPARGFGAGAGVNVRVLCLARVTVAEQPLADTARDDDEAHELGALHEVTAVRDPLPTTPAEDQQLGSLVCAVKEVMTQWVARARAWDLGPHCRGHDELRPGSDSLSRRVGIKHRAQAQEHLRKFLGNPDAHVQGSRGGHGELKAVQPALGKRAGAVQKAVGTLSSNERNDLARLKAGQHVVLVHGWGCGGFQRP